MVSIVIDKFNFGGVEVTIVKRISEYDYSDFWFCGYVACNSQIEIDPDFPTQGYTDNGEVMLLNQPELGLVGWYHYWDTAHAGWENTAENLFSVMLQDLREGNY